VSREFVALAGFEQGQQFIERLSRPLQLLDDCRTGSRIV
jgi:hypothetical protein